ncbi:hypothetical protein FRB94_004346 [Tulasnella sp. JGI-2019a]|nr:hypothetical protein FRB94_004346 [Tulasnella sp. JGI-2019a]
MSSLLFHLCCHLSPLLIHRNPASGMDDHASLTTEISFADDTDTATSYNSSIRAAGNKSGRGRKRDDSLPYNRARDTQREFRARRQAHLEELEERNLELEIENGQLRAALELEPSPRRPIGTGPTGLGRPRFPLRSPAKIEAGDASEISSESGSALSTPFHSPLSTTLVPVTPIAPLSPPARPRASPDEQIPLSTAHTDYSASTMYFHHEDSADRNAASWPTRRHTAPSIPPTSGSCAWADGHTRRIDAAAVQVESPLEAGLRIEATRRQRTDAFVVQPTRTHHDHHLAQATPRLPYPSSPPAPFPLPRFDSDEPSIAHWSHSQENGQHATRQRSHSQRYEASSNDFGLMNPREVSEMPMELQFPGDSGVHQRPINHPIAAPQYMQRMDAYSQGRMDTYNQSGLQQI